MYRLLAHLLFQLSLVTATVAQDDEKILNVYNWADYIGDTTIADFEAEYGIKVNYDIYDSSPIVDAKLLAGRSGYDVVLHAASFGERLQRAGIFMPLEKDRLSNWHNLDPKALARFEQYDPGLRYGMPYMWGTTGFTYNERMILERMPDAPVHSSAMIFDPAIVSRFADCGVSMLEAATDVIPMVLSYLGRDPTSVEQEDLDAAVEVLQKTRQYYKYYSGTKLTIDLPAEEVCIAGSWSGDFAVANRTAREEGLDLRLRYTVPVEGSSLWFDAWYIPADAPHPENAHLFLNFLLRPRVIAATTNDIAYANPNLAANPLVLKEFINHSGIYPDEEILKRLSAGILYPPKIERRRTRAWTRAKSGL